MITPLLAFIFGLCVGSFLNVAAIRFPKGETIVRGRSHCLACKKELGWMDMIPGVSFFLLAGKCRFCKTPFSFQYVLVELLCGGLFFLVALKFGAYPFEAAFFLFFAAMLLLISIVDIRSQLIPSSFLALVLCGGLLYIIAPALLRGAGLPFAQGLQTIVPSANVVPFLFFPPLPAFFDNLLYARLASACFTGGVILFLVLITRERGMGMGDVPIGFLQGLLLGYPGGLLALFLSFIMGAIVGIGLIIKGKAGMKTAVPFAPFLVAGLFIVLFAG